MKQCGMRINSSNADPAKRAQEAAKMANAKAR
jgi:hypothetical protein